MILGGFSRRDCAKADFLLIVGFAPTVCNVGLQDRALREPMSVTLFAWSHGLCILLVIRQPCLGDMEGPGVFLKVVGWRRWDKIDKLDVGYA